ncbi:unnamed protein product [Mytilus edulis]|uniref:Uncharacterized protein n=1 Tax=Mytilus edulis TaxID=6550 RepID=A0A8S3UHW7_MYTED|nr:unnamed protein product [Mytilus edulis]
MKSLPVDLLFFVLLQVAETVTRSSRNGHNIPQVVGNIQDPVMFYEWTPYLQQYFKTLKHITDYHHFYMDSQHPGLVTCRENASEFMILLLSTSEIENFQNLILMYASIRHCYSQLVYSAKNRLAALDHNAHAEREVMKNKDDSLRSGELKTSRWLVHPVKEDTKYSYIQDLIRQIVISKIEDDIGMSRRLELEADDPKRISAHLVPVPSPINKRHCG